MLLNNVHHISHELILERYCFVLGCITLSDIDVKEAGALPWSPELGDFHEEQPWILKNMECHEHNQSPIVVLGTPTWIMGTFQPQNSLIQL